MEIGDRGQVKQVTQLAEMRVARTCPEEPERTVLEPVQQLHGAVVRRHHRRSAGNAVQDASPGDVGQPAEATSSAARRLRANKVEVTRGAAAVHGSRQLTEWWSSARTACQGQGLGYTRDFGDTRLITVEKRRAESRGWTVCEDSDDDFLGTFNENVSFSPLCPYGKRSTNQNQCPSIHNWIGYADLGLNYRCIMY